MKERIIVILFLIILIVFSLFALGRLDETLERDERIRNNPALECQKTYVYCMGE